MKDRPNFIGVDRHDDLGLEVVAGGSIDISEDSLVTRAEGLLSRLLLDRTTGRNLIWAGEYYEHFGDAYAPDREMTIELITGRHGLLIQPRVEKSKAQQWNRTKGRAEVFTPAWLCNEQNNQIDEAWFGRPNVFNTPAGKSWIPCGEKVSFDSRNGRTWKAYVDDRRLEVACGEGPYLVSRYDAVSGGVINVGRRIGLLDRKLRVVTENTRDADEWRRWARRAVESIYGFEYHGDSVLLARENILASYEDYSLSVLGVEPVDAELADIASVVSWNIWQMDLLSGCPPLQNDGCNHDSRDLFGGIGKNAPRPCRIRDWRSRRMHDFGRLASANGVML